MKLNNSIKLAIANFSLFWKIFLYKILAFGISFLLFLPVFNVVKNAFSTAGFFDEISKIFSYSVISNTGLFFTDSLEVFHTFFKGLQLLTQYSMIGFIYFVVLILFIIPFLFKLSVVPTSESVYNYMSSLNKNSFTINFINLFKKSVKFSAFKAMLDIPFILITTAGFYGIVRLHQFGGLLTFITPLLIFVFAVAMFAIIITVNNGLSPSIVVFDISLNKSVKKGICAVKRNFNSVLSSFLVVMTVFFAMVYLFGFYAIIILLPLMSLVISVFGQVLFFESQGMDYYLSVDQIVTVRKLENSDNIKKVRMII